MTVIVCTRDEPGRVRRALDSVIAQSFLDWEALVVHHGESDLTHLVPVDERVSVISIGRQTTGAAWATGLVNARGSYIAYCDDRDDWSRNHLSSLLTAIEGDPKIGLVFSDAEWIDQTGRVVPPPAVKTWPGAAQTPFIFASTMMHRIEASRDVGGFDAYVDAFADWDLVLRISDWWEIRHLPTVLGQLEADPFRPELRSENEDDRLRIAGHAMARRIRVPIHRPVRKPPVVTPSFDPATWSDERRELDVVSIWDSPTSYTSVIKGLIPALKRQGISPYLYTSGEVDTVFDGYPRSSGAERRMVFVYHIGVRPRTMGIHPLIQYSMSEIDLVPRVHVEEINNHVSLFLVPCQHNVEIFRASGVTTPIMVLHHGIDPNAFPLLERPLRETLTFGTFGQQTYRKGADLLLKAFSDEFSAGESVRLVLNATITGSWLETRDPRVDIRSGFLDHNELLRYLNELDVFVLPSRGEGFGLCGLEAMATGLPTIATNWSGPADYLDPDDSLPLNYTLKHMAGWAYGPLRLFGQWAEPDYEHLRSLMRWAYEHREAVQEMGRRASARVHRDWTWDRIAMQLRDMYDMLARGASPMVDDVRDDLSS